MADGPDPLQYYQDFRHQGWLNKTRNPAERPSDDLWYRFTLLKERGKLYLLLVDARRTDPGVPVLVWEDRGIVGGRVPAGSALRIAQTGAGDWRRLTIWKYGYTGDRPPPMPTGLTAEAHGGGRLALRWQSERSDRAGFTYEVRRDGQPTATGVHGTTYDDFDVVPNMRYSFQVRTVNRLGLASDFAEVDGATDTGGPTSLVSPTESADVQAPMEVAAEEYVWAPRGAGRYLEEPPEEGLAELTLALERTGTYAVWGEVIAPDKATDSFYIACDAPLDGPYRTWSTGVHPQWEWSRAITSLDLDAGEHTFRLKPRESGTKLKALLLTDDLGYAPGGG